MSIPRRSLGATPRQSDSASFAPARTPVRPPPAAVSAQDILRCIREGILHAFRQPDVQSAVAEALAPFITVGERGKKRGRPLRDDDDDDDDESEPADRRSSSRGLDGTIMKARLDVVELMDSKTVRFLFLFPLFASYCIVSLVLILWGSSPFVAVFSR